ncbi:MAG: DNA helicase [Candidatus Mesenet longicola]|uniref:DNA 3'-5' helicase n=1 Tax=Candidatus Mesenet longicola TaxID=1892558 RepID=A0A8J3HVG1_9RICK|nr:MAG: DNA helicase [Candidatus Mesenet longicola]GHM60022.1 MAG: DNA helicase [Candidatus Mesenet longicola]
MDKTATDPNLSVWISASAGTGKTKILIDRVLKLLLAGKKNILCLTFTSAAANEMVDRINAVLGVWSTCSNDQLMKSLLSLFDSKLLHSHLLRARQLFGQLPILSLTIQTIHAFCYKLISNFPAEAGIALGYTLDDCSRLHTKVMSELLIDNSAQEYLSFIAAEIDEEKLKSLFLSLLQNKIYDVEKVFLKLGSPKRCDEIPQATVENIKKLAEILNQGSKRDKKYSTVLMSWYNLPPDDRLDKLNSLIKILIDPKLLTKKNASSIITKNTLENFPEAKEIILKEQDIILKIFEELGSYQIATRTINLLNLFKRFTTLYLLEKKKNALLDYDDVITLALHLITDDKSRDWILFNLDSKIDHILVDEAQDNSSAQWQVIINLCAEFFAGIGTTDEKRTIFIIGDVKQSIYRFQGANPMLFNAMHEYLKEQSHKEDWLSLKLSQSFRSTGPILLLVDTLFNNFRQEISFLDERIEHIPFRKNDQGYVEIWPLLPKINNEKQIALQTSVQNQQNPNRILAATLVYRINKWLKEGRILPAKNRHIEAKDIMILIRQRNILIDYLIGEFKKFNIPVLGRDCFKIMDYIAVQDLVALAEFLLLPENDMALACVLKSPLLNFTEEDLLSIAYNRKDKSLWTQLKTYNQQISVYLEDLINKSHNYSPLFLYTYILTFENKKKFAARLGKECLEVIDEFMNLLIQFEHKSLQSFTEWIKENNPEIKNDINSEHEAVRIMTIHKAKGLQAPIVFLADTTSVPKSGDAIIFDEEGTPFWCGTNSNSYCNQIKEEKSREDYNEYLRLLYVAMTRAEDELYILGKEPMHNKSWYNLIKMQVYEKKYANLYPMFKEEVEVRSINRKYPQIYRKRDYLNVEPTEVPKHKSDFEHIREERTQEGIDRGKIIHKVLQHLSSVPNERREDWIRSYLSSMNLSVDIQNEITDKMISFYEKFSDLLTSECKTEVAINGVIDDEVVSIRLDMLCIAKDKVTIIDYKSHRSPFLSEEIKQQMSRYRALVQDIFPNKKIECVIIWLEDLSVILLNN